jgi:hypothetical protein
MNLFDFKNDTDVRVETYTDIVDERTVYVRFSYPLKYIKINFTINIPEAKKIKQISDIEIKWPG